MHKSGHPVHPGRSATTDTITFPLGPFHPALTQPLALTLALRGETITSVETPGTGYCRRGVAALVENQPVDSALALVERSCALAGGAHRRALCQAIEAAAGIAPAKSARVARVLFAEVERIQARLWTLALVARAAGLSDPFGVALEQRETLFEALHAATGTRAFHGVAVPGGVRGDLEVKPLALAIEQLAPVLEDWRAVVGPKGALGQAGTGAGLIAAERVEALALTGVAAGGSHDAVETRRADASTYANLDVTWPEIAFQPAGDVAARLTWVVADMLTSAAIARACLTKLGDAAPAAAPALKTPTRDASGDARVEGPHGSVQIAATLTRTGTVTGLKLGTSGTATVAALPEVMTGSRLENVPMILASLDLCLECFDQ